MSAERCWFVVIVSVLLALLLRALVGLYHTIISDEPDDPRDLL
jgi:hypothetical protein